MGRLAYQFLIGTISPAEIIKELKKQKAEYVYQFLIGTISPKILHADYDAQEKVSIPHRYHIPISTKESYIKVVNDIVDWNQNVSINSS